ncbi:hypothetical protein B0H34DRAFT_802299 [Crassisporium funariophilum]|nr:hypothetical protein B0H34DRAFT_802299 [Crassisporium funariophilum]
MATAPGQLQPQPHNAAANLPTELLALIFSSLISDDYAVEDSELTRQKRHVEALMLQAISHTCHRWRDVALGCSTLWGRVLDVNFSSLARIEEVIVRSKASPLFVQEIASECDWDSSSKGTAIFAHLNRFKVFHLVLDQEILGTESLYLALCLPAPLLESFRLKFSCPDTEDEQPFVFLELFFKGNAPNLRDIFLHGCAFPKILTQNIKLTSLKVIQADRKLSASVAQWLQMAARCPELEDLTICDAFGQDLDAEAHSPLLEVTLPRLRNLNIKGDVEECARLLGNLQLPASCSVFIDATA